MKIIENKTFDEERALYDEDGVKLISCSFDGARDGESALKEAKNIEAEACFFNLRYPFWHDENVKIDKCGMSDKCRAALWYSKNITITESVMNGVKAVRECEDIKISNTVINSVEFGWFNKRIEILDSEATGEYFMLRSSDVTMRNVAFKGKYSFQYIENATFESCRFFTKDAFWHAKNVTVKDSVIEGEYLGWYSEGLTLINCKILGTQPLCYCKNLTLIDCEMIGCDLSFERSEVTATLTAPIISIKNPLSGRIKAPEIGDIVDELSGGGCEITVG